MATKKKRRLSPEGRKRISEAQKKRHAAKSDDLPNAEQPKASELRFNGLKYDPDAAGYQGITRAHVNHEERPEDAARRMAQRATILETEIGEKQDQIEDLQITLKNELFYHRLRVTELTRELERQGITIP